MGEGLNHLKSKLVMRNLNHVLTYYSIHLLSRIRAISNVDISKIILGVTEILRSDRLVTSETW